MFFHIKVIILIGIMYPLFLYRVKKLYLFHVSDVWFELEIYKYMLKDMMYDVDIIILIKGNTMMRCIIYVLN